jgi:hypothetical protein
MVFNAVFVAAAALAGLVLPTSGFSAPVFLALSVGYLALAAAYTRLTSGTVRTTDSPTTPGAR